MAVIKYAAMSSKVPVWRSKPMDSLSRLLLAIANWFGRPKLLVILLTVTLAIVVAGATALWFAEQSLGGEQDFRIWNNAFWYMFSSVAGIGVGARTPLTESGRTLAIIAGVSGSALKGVFTAAVASAFVNRLILEGKGLGDYDINNHILICGWNSNAKEMLKVLDEQAHGQGLQVVLLADLLENPLPQSRIKFVRGDPTLDSDLERASAAGARSAILLADESHGPVDPGTADARTVLTALAVECANADIYTVAEVRDPTNRRHFARTKTDELVASAELAGGLLARSALNPGVGLVFETLIRLDRSAEVYVIPTPMSCAGKTFDHALQFLRRERAVILIGLQSAGKVVLNPPGSRMLVAADNLIIVSDSKPASV
jgi:voltage-gated potassium channel